MSSRYEMGQTTRSEWEKDMKEHRELLRNVIEEHREGRDGGVMDWSDIAAELAFEEEKVYPPVHMLASSNPPSVVKGKRFPAINRKIGSIARVNAIKGVNPGYLKNKT